MDIQTVIFFLVFLNGYFPIELAIFIIFVRKYLKNKNSEDKIWLSENWKSFKRKSKLLETFIVFPWTMVGLWGSIFTMDDGTTNFFFILNAILFILTVLMECIRSFVSIKWWFRKRKYYKNNS